jgi:hypothetical protein
VTYSAGWWGQLFVLLIPIALLINLIRLDIKHATLGTKSVLYGAHCFFLHPWFVAKAWHQLYGWRRVKDRYVGEVSLLNPRLWLVFMLHDIGYIGKVNMDDEIGETHPNTGAVIAGKMFGQGWYWFSLLHSRYYAKRLNMPPSLLCIADKLSLALTPGWLYLPAVRATGEIAEYMRLDLQRAAAGEVQRVVTYADEQRVREREVLWFKDVQKYMRDWVEEHKDGREDSWTRSLFKSVTQEMTRSDYVVAGEDLNKNAAVRLGTDGKAYAARTPITDTGVTE